MAGMRFKFNNENVKAQFERNLVIRGYVRASDAARFALNEASRRMLEAGREDIKAGGNFGARWLASLQTKIEPASTRTVNLVLTISHSIPYAKIFEYGGVINGRPLLWIPLPWNPTKVRARDFPGKLFRVDRRGKNPLLMKSGGKGQPAQAMYVGVKSVRQKRRFHMRGIIKRVAAQMPALFKRALRLSKR